MISIFVRLADSSSCCRYTVHSLSAIFSDPASANRRKLHFNNLDMSPQEMKEWEEQEMEKSIDYTSLK